MSDARFLQTGFAKRLSHVIEECGEVLAANAVDGLREALARIIHDTMENDDDSGGGSYMRAADAVLATLSRKDASPQPERRPAADLEKAAGELNQHVFATTDASEPDNWNCKGEAAKNIYREAARAVAASLGITFEEPS